MANGFLDNAPGYETSFGQHYEYDLTDPSDQIKYETDIGAQIRDETYLDINPYREMEEDLGEEGGGYLPNHPRVWGIDGGTEENEN